MSSFKKPISMRNRTLIIVAFVLIAVISIALVATMIKLNSTIETKNLAFTAYEIGAIDDSGENYSSTASIRTKNYYLLINAYIFLK